MIPLSVIIPARNEGGYIGQCLDTLAGQETDGAVQVVVVANGCRDDTAAIARARIPAFSARGWRLDVLDRPEGGKIGALNAGDDASIHAGRLYLDADVIVGAGLLAAMAAALDVPRPLYAGARLVVSPANSRVTRAYGRFWSALPFMTQNVTGAGLFAVNAAGRRRWGRFPALISDDGFVRLQFAPAERLRVEARYDWPLAEGFAQLVRVRRRQDAGMAEIARLYPELSDRRGHDRPGAGGLLRLAARDPAGFAAYAAVAVAVRLGRSQGGWTRGR